MLKLIKSSHLIGLRIKSLNYYNFMDKTLKHIKQYTYNIDAGDLKSVRLTKDKQLCAVYILDGTQTRWTGEIVKIYNDKNGQAVSYDIYLY